MTKLTEAIQSEAVHGSCEGGVEMHTVSLGEAARMRDLVIEVAVEKVEEIMSGQATLERPKKLVIDGLRSIK